MTNRDGKAHEGKGPKTGRQKGNCEGVESESDFPGRSFGKRPRRFERKRNC